jgi:hypothetical protein
MERKRVVPIRGRMIETVTEVVVNPKLEQESREFSLVT